MSNFTKIKAKIEQIENLLAEIKEELEILSRQGVQRSKATVRSSQKPLPSDEELQAEYEKLYEKFVNKESDAIVNFVKEKSRNYLKLFCKANSLPINVSKVSKEHLVRELNQWFAQRHSISKGIV